MDKVYATVTIKVIITDKEEIESIMEDAVERFDHMSSGEVIDWDFTVTDSK